MSKRDTRSIQTHHISYNPEIKCTVFRGEHEVLTKLRRMGRNPPSRAFVEQLGIWLIGNNERGIDLDATEKEVK